MRQLALDQTRQFGHSKAGILSHSQEVRRVIISKTFEVVLVDTEQRQLGVRRQLLEVGPGELLRRHAAAPLVAVPHLQYSCQRDFQPQFQQEKALGGAFSVHCKM